MRIGRLAGILGIAALLGSTAAFAASLQSRDEVSSFVKKACEGDAAGCVGAVDQLLSTANLQGCDAGSVGIAQGLADATSAVNGRDSALATKMAETVALNGKQCLQVAFGAVVDGTGTAAIQDAAPLAGSAG